MAALAPLPKSRGFAALAMSQESAHARNTPTNAAAGSTRGTAFCMHTSVGGLERRDGETPEEGGRSNKRWAGDLPESGRELYCNCELYAGGESLSRTSGVHLNFYPTSIGTATFTIGAPRHGARSAVRPPAGRSFPEPRVSSNCKPRASAGARPGSGGLPPGPRAGCRRWAEAPGLRPIALWRHRARAGHRRSPGRPASPGDTARPPRGLGSSPETVVVASRARRAPGFASRETRHLLRCVERGRRNVP